MFVFPNNGNVIFAANQAAELAEKEVHVIPTKNVAMGIAAAVAFQDDVSGEEKKKLTVPDLLALFSKVSGSDEADDKLLLS